MEKISAALNKNPKRTLIVRLSIILGFLALFLLFTFLDKQASDALYGGNNLFGNIFSYTFFIVGYVPAIFVDAVLFACAFWLVKNKVLRGVFAVLVYSAIFGAIYTVFESFPDATSGVKFGICGGLATVLVFPVIWGIGKLEKDNLKKLFYIFLFGAIMATIAILLVAPIQYLWGRDRYFTLINSVEGAAYTPWYLPQGYSAQVDFRSFPSMHSSSAASMVMLIVLAWAFDFKKPLKITMWAIAILIMVCVPLSRVVMGWHYFTDVLFGAFLAYISAEIALVVTDKLIYKNKEELLTA